MLARNKKEEMERRRKYEQEKELQLREDEQENAMTCKPLFSNFSCNFKQFADHQRFQDADEKHEQGIYKNARPSAMKFLDKTDS